MIGFSRFIAGLCHHRRTRPASTETQDGMRPVEHEQRIVSFCAINPKNK
jgi:hypothetical protein